MSSSQNTNKSTELYELLPQINLTNPDSSLFFLDSCINLPENEDNIEFVSKCYLEKGRIYKELNKHSEAIAAISMVLPYYVTTNRMNEVAFSNYLLGYCNYELGNFDASINSLKLAIHLYDSLENDEMHYITLNVLAANLIYLNKRDLANEIYLRVKQYAEDSKDTNLLAKCYGNLAIISSFDSSKFEHTIEYYQNSIRYFLLLKNEAGASNVYMNLGIQYTDHKRFKEGYKTLQIAKALNNKNYNFSLDIYIENALAYLFLQLGNLDSTIFYSNKVITKSLENKYYHLLPESYSALAQIYKKHGAYELALKNTENALLWKDTTWHTALMETTAKLENSFMLEKQTIDIDLKQAVIEKQNLKIKNQKQKTVLMGIVVIIFGILLGITLNVSKKLKLANNDLNNKNLIIKEKNKHLENTIATRDKLTSIIVHDIRNPLATIAGISSLICQKQNGDDLTKIKYYANEIQISTSNLFELLDNLLHWISVQKESIQIKKEPLKIKAVVDKNIELLKIVALSKQITILNACSVNEIIYADSLTLNTIVRNLINNALKFTPERGSINITCELKQNQTLIHIKDTGIGISLDDIPKLFNSKSDKSTIGDGTNKGIGLGLSLCNDFAELNGGFLSVTSTLGKGSCFTLHMPHSIT